MGKCGWASLNTLNGCVVTALIFYVYNPRISSKGKPNVSLFRFVIQSLTCWCV